MRNFIWINTIVTFVFSCQQNKLAAKVSRYF